MSEDKRIREIRDALAVCDNDVSVPYEYLSDTVRAVLSEEPPTPRVWFPGDTVPAKVRGIDRGGWFHGDLSQSWVLHRGITGDALVEIFEPTRGEWQATVDQARAERDQALRADRHAELVEAQASEDTLPGVTP